MVVQSSGFGGVSKVTLIRVLTIIFSVVLVSGPARGEGIFFPSFMFDRDTVKDSTGQFPDTSRRQFHVDLRLGYYFDLSGFYLGALYRYEDFDFLGTEAQGFASGPTVGYIREPFVFTVSYLIGAERRYTVAGSENKLSRGSGYQAAIAYLFAFEPDIRIGPQLVYRTIEYSRSQVGTAVESDVPLSEASLKPALAIWFAF